MNDTRIITIADSKCDLVIFSLPDGGAQAVITRPKFGSTEPGEKSITHYIDPPPKGRRIAMVRRYGGVVEVVYRDAPDGK